MTGSYESGAQHIDRYTEAQRAANTARTELVDFLRTCEGKMVQVKGFPSRAIFISSPDGVEVVRTLFPVYSILEDTGDRLPRHILGRLEVPLGSPTSVDIVAPQEEKPFAGYRFPLNNLVEIEVVDASQSSAEVKEPVYEI